MMPSTDRVTVLRVRMPAKSGASVDVAVALPKEQKGDSYPTRDRGEEASGDAAPELVASPNERMPEPAGEHRTYDSPKVLASGDGDQVPKAFWLILIGWSEPVSIPSG